LEEIAKMEWEVLPHLSNGPDLAPSNYLRICEASAVRQGRQYGKQCVSVVGWLERNFTEGEFSNSQNAGRNVYKEVAIMWTIKERSVD
jgi:hypothetical protein